MSKNFPKVKGYYDRGYWNVDRVRAAVGKWVTEEEFTLITGLPYQP